MNRPSRPLRLAVLLSGEGTNLQALIDAIAADRLDARIVGVFSNRPDAEGLERARRTGLPTDALDPAEFGDRAAFDRALADRIESVTPDVLVMAGFMRILSPEFIQRFRGRMLNIHPSLLPNYRGLNTHRRALENGDAKHGTSVHFVTEELDGGPVVAQAVLPVEPGDDEQRLAERVKAREHVLYPAVIQWLVEGRLQWNDGKIRFDDKPLERPLRFDRVEHAAAV